MAEKVESTPCCPNSDTKCDQEAEKSALSQCPLFDSDCQDCDFCAGLNSFSVSDGGNNEIQPKNPSSSPFKSLSILDKLLGLFVLIAMILGVIIGVYAEDGVREHLVESAQWKRVSVPILVGLLFMIWPALAKVQWEKLADFYKDLKLWIHVAMSIFINWVISPLLMLALAWATLPDETMERYRRGVLLVGIVLFSPYSLLFVNILGGNSSGPDIEIDYEETATSVAIYLGIPLAAGLLTRFALLKFASPKFRGWFYDVASKIGLIGLLYTIIVLFAAQGTNITQNIGKVFRTVVPLILYFVLVWTLTFAGFWRLNYSRRFSSFAGGYERAVTQAFTAGSNNFELAIAVATASFGPDSPETVAATLGPLIEVPVLLLLSYVALYLRPKLFKEEESKVRLEQA
ncbi:hypothetical protein E3P92_01982 [Wallemia ichthyophaga]|uniref:Arsenite resistance protein ArsB n=1 Tax=Wallemia ichthyophaga TaxID=245174 RepID=A0A4T0GA29_WALIC|nr:hypothetical protein E3P97_00541 [Wallemia ichthyophaga]TIA98011.1 hypothetical protein E3P96_03266 [Wallemia ichthyophaga]TIB04365.1 hypothetical protein E3P95_00349 [Wallemia ichthyophaga]TIB05477.1 hypothetical protein E3P94_00349 [Wallemia ichthyophaga]TIB12821.1 hypothetical protein E3P90_01955 [Wallemia ichthyophaga]